MTYREKRARKAERLRDWSAANEAKSEQRGRAADQIAEHIPFGQPILVGHHSERRHRRDLNRIHSNMGASVELGAKAKRQAEIADNIEAALESSIYDDDPDAIERLQEKIAALEAKRQRMKQANAKYRSEHRDELKAMTPYQRNHAVPFPSYALSNLTGVLSNTKDRLARLQRERDKGPTDRMITARFDSQCADCGGPLAKGETIRFNRQQGARCVTCPKVGAR